MTLINFPGLNCHTSSVFTAANALGVDFERAFATLWSEHDFLYDASRHGYRSKRLWSNLRALGARIDDLPSSNFDESASSLAATRDGDLLIVGMDTFFVPWSPRYRQFSGAHCFVAEVRGGELVCHDPTYSRLSVVLPLEALIEHNNGLSRISKCALSRFEPDLHRELTDTIELLRSGRLLAELAPTLNTRREFELRSWYVDCLVGNRRMFARYLRSLLLKTDTVLHSEEHYNGWTAVKFGLHKCSISSNNAQQLGEVRTQLHALLVQELEAAVTINSASCLT